MPYQNSPHYIDQTPGTNYYCTCVKSVNKPYCDVSHETKKTGKQPMQYNVDAARRMAICDCGKTGNSPFCDGTHSK